MLRVPSLGILVVALVLASRAGANPVVPKDPPKVPAPAAGPNVVPVEVEIAGFARQVTVIVPVGLLQQPPRKGADAGPLHPAIIGLALAGAFITGGFWLVRGGRGTRSAVAGLLLLGAVVAGSFVQANFAPPPRPIPVALPAGLTIPNQMAIELSPTAKTIKFIVPPGQVLRKEQPKEVPPPPG